VTEPTIRQVCPEEMPEAVYPLTSYGLHPSPPLPDREDWRERVIQRQGITCYAAYEGKTSVACAVSSPMTQNLRGAILGMGGIWGVATHPAARRKGYCRTLIARLLETMRDSGRPLSALYPFRESFYERLGFVTLPQSRIASLEPSKLAPLLKKDLGGKVEMALIGEAHDAYLKYVVQMQQRTHGMAKFDFVRQVDVQRNRFWLAQAVVDGETVGLMQYNLTGEHETEYTLRAGRFYYRTSRGKYLLLQWIARHIDQANRAELWLPAFEQPETWLSDMNISLDRPPHTPMGRVVDLAQINGMRTGPGRLCVCVRDPLCPWNAGVWRLESANGRLQIRQGGQADCELTIQGVSALVYGAHDPGDFPIRGWGNPSPEVLATMRTMFPPKLAYLHEWF
jgi:predicted acetyltransferase